MKNILPFPMAKLKKMRRKKTPPRTLVLGQNTLLLLWPQKLLSSPHTEHCFMKIHYCCMVVVYHHVFITNSRKKKRINLGYSPLQLTHTISWKTVIDSFSFLCICILLNRWKKPTSRTVHWTSSSVFLFSLDMERFQWWKCSKTFGTSQQNRSC